MKCPHCAVTIHDDARINFEEKDIDGHWAISQQHCPACKRIVLTLLRYHQEGSTGGFRAEYLFRPKVSGREPLPEEVPDEFAADYKEACLVLGDSPKASAALSRRCLQHVLEEKAGVKKGSLADEIQEVVDSGKLPSHLVASLDAVRNIGNFSAHAIKSNSSGEIVEVEPGEAEWNLDVLEGLFDFYFVGPAKTEARRDALNAKLTEAGKPPMKGTP